MPPIDPIESRPLDPILAEYRLQRFAWRDDAAIPLQRDIAGVVELAGTPLLLGGDGL